MEQSCYLVVWGVPLTDSVLILDFQVAFRLSHRGGPPSSQAPTWSWGFHTESCLVFPWFLSLLQVLLWFQAGPLGDKEKQLAEQTSQHSNALPIHQQSNWVSWPWKTFGFDLCFKASFPIMLTVVQRFQLDFSGWLFTGFNDCREMPCLSFHEFTSWKDVCVE